MPNTMDLWERAQKVHTKTEWAKMLGIHVSTWTNVQNKGHVSPIVAAGLALELGEDPKEWIAIAALEAAPETPLKTKLRKRLSTARKLYLSTLPARGVIRQRVNHTHHRAPRNAGSHTELTRH